VDDSFFAKLGTRLWSNLPTLRRTNPQWAAGIGFLFGGIGLAIYFRSFIDLIAPLAIAIVAAVFIGPAAGWLAGAVIAAIYGFSRAQDSNRRLDKQDAESPPVPAGVES
jgi:hypothetical protein